MLFRSKEADQRIETLKKDIGITNEFKIQDSKKNNLVQLADMITGAAAKRTSHKGDKDFYFNLVKVRCVDYKYYPEELLTDLRQNKTAL